MKGLLRLRKPAKADKNYFLKWWTDPELIALTSGRPAPVGQLEKYFADLLGAKHNFMITVDGRVIGHVRLMPRGRKAFGFPIVIGERRYRGRGYGSEAIRRMLRLGFGRLGYELSRIEVRPENVEAIRTYEALGFRSRGVKRRKNPYQPRVLVMVLSRNDFLRQSSRSRGGGRRQGRTS